MMRPLLVVVGLLASAPALAQLYCSPPREPTCIDMLNVLRDSLNFQMCRDEVEEYRRQVREYINCLQEEQDATIRRLNETVERFNTCARSQFC